MFYVKILLETPVSVARAGQAKSCIKGIFIVRASLEVFLCNSLITKCLRCCSDAPVVVCEFKSIAGCSGCFFKRNVAQFHVLSKSVVPGSGGSSNHGFQCFFSIDGKSFYNCIGKNGDAVIAGHAPVLVGHMAPDWQHVMGALLVVLKHGLYHVLCLLRLHQSQEGVLCAVGIPQRENGVVGKAFSLVKLVVQATVKAVNVHVNGRVYHGMIKAGVEHCFFCICAFYLYAVQLLFPGSNGL